MLPTSHVAPIIAPVPALAPEPALCAQVIDMGSDAALHEVGEQEPKALKRVKNATLLAGEFSEFISAAAKLETSYRALQEEVSELGRELSDRNAALESSLADNARMRLALQQIVDSMPCGVLVLDCDANITMINPECRSLLGLPPSVLPDPKPVTLRQISAASGINLEAQYADQSASDAAQEFAVRSGHGMRWIEVRKRRVTYRRARRPEQTILILRDVTAQKRAEQEREAARRTAALAELTSILAHEIRNPLASLELFAELIENDNAQRAEWISNLRAGIRSLSGTVNNVLSFHGTGSLHLAPVELSTLIHHAVDFARPIADQAAVTLEWLPSSKSRAGGNEFRVMGNEGALRQVVLNLVSNAIRHTPAGGRVTVSLRSEPGDDGAQLVTAEFSDTGCGIRPDQINRIFEPGFSGSGDTSGLGLAVCDRIVKQHGGAISVTNRVPSGAQFKLQFRALLTESAQA